MESKYLLTEHVVDELYLYYSDLLLYVLILLILALKMDYISRTCIFGWKAACLPNSATMQTTFCIQVRELLNNLCMLLWITITMQPDKLRPVTPCNLAK